MVLRRVLCAVAAAQRPFGLGPFVRFAAHHFLGQVHAFERRPVGGHGGQRFGVDAAALDVCGVQVQNHSVRRAAVADAPRQTARIDARNRHQFVGLEPFVEIRRRAPVGRFGDVGAQDAAAHRGLVGFHVFEVGADVADVGKGEGDHLSGERRVGQGFLIPREAGVEAHFAQRHAFGASAAPPKHRTVVQHQGGVAACRAGRVEVIKGACGCGARGKIRPLRLGGGVLLGLGHGGDPQGQVMSDRPVATGKRRADQGRGDLQAQGRQTQSTKRRFVCVYGNPRRSSRLT